MAKAKFPAEWGLTLLEAAYLTALRPGGIVSVEQLAKLHDRSLKNPRKSVYSMVAQLKRKLDPYNVEIATHWSEGWELKRAARQRLTTLLKAR